MRHTEDRHTVSSCVTLCMLCSIDPVLLRVDFDSLTRIKAYLKEVRSIIFCICTLFNLQLPTTPDEPPIDPTELFLSFYAKPSDLLESTPNAQIKQALSLLEKATSTQEALLE